MRGVRVAARAKPSSEARCADSRQRDGNSRHRCRWADFVPSPGWIADPGWERLAKDRPVRRSSRSSLFGLRGPAALAVDWVGGPGTRQWRGYREWESYSTASGLASDIVYEILPRADGSLWVATEGRAVAGRAPGSGIQWKKVAGLDGFPVHSVRMAPDGDLWIGTEAHGAARIHVRTGGGVVWRGARSFGQGSVHVALRSPAKALGRDGSGTVCGHRSVSEVFASRRIAGDAHLGGRRGKRWHDLGRGRRRAFRVCRRALEEFHARRRIEQSGSAFAGRGRRMGRCGSVIASAAVSTVFICSRTAWPSRKASRGPGTDGLVYFLEFDASGRLVGGHRAGRGHVGRFPLEPLRYERRPGVGRLRSERFAQEADGTVWIGTSGGLSGFKPRPQPPPEVPIEVVFTKLVMGGTDVSGQRNPSFRLHSNSLIARYSAPNVSNVKPQSCFATGSRARIPPGPRRRRENCSLQNWRPEHIGWRSKPRTAMECGAAIRRSSPSGF